jgi:hypothetical protein
MILPLLLGLAMAGCNKTNTTQQDPTEPAAPAPNSAVNRLPANEAAPAIAAKPAASNPANAPAVPPVAATTPQLAPPGVFYLIKAARVETADGVTGLPPGTGVKLLHDDVYLTPAGQARLGAEMLTNDLNIARQARDGDRAAQNAVQARIASDSAASAARARQTATAPSPGPAFPVVSSAAPQAVAEPTPVKPPLGSSLSRPEDALNTTHSKTKDNVFTDAQGRQYWKDIYGRRHYSF